MDEDTMVIGAYQDRNKASKNRTGSVYVYRRQEGTHWALEKKISPPDNGNAKYFGRFVAIKGNRIAVGDRAYDTRPRSELKLAKLPPMGAFWVYEHNTSTGDWTEPNPVTTNYGCDGWFGASLAFTDNLGLLVGCPREDKKAGAVYYYEPSNAGYVLRQKMVASGLGKGVGSADKVSVHGSVMTVGTDKGVHLFLRVNNTWVNKAEIVPPEESDGFGNGVAMSGNQVIVSSDSNVYFYELVDIHV